MPHETEKELVLVSRELYDAVRRLVAIQQDFDDWKYQPGRDDDLQVRSEMEHERYKAIRAVVDSMTKGSGHHAA